MSNKDLILCGLLRLNLQNKEIAIIRSVSDNGLLIPTFIWTFILVAPQIFFERKLQGNHQSYFDFYQSFLAFQWWPEGNFIN